MNRGMKRCHIKYFSTWAFGESIAFILRSFVTPPTTYCGKIPPALIIQKSSATPLSTKNSMALRQGEACIDCPSRQQTPLTNELREISKLKTMEASFHRLKKNSSAEATIIIRPAPGQQR
jgi:hypothetical protein